MVIEVVVNVFTKIFTSILSVFNLPSIGDTLLTVSDFLNNYVFTAFDVIDIFLPIGFFSILLIPTIALIIAEDYYSLMIWIVRKIPFLGMS